MGFVITHQTCPKCHHHKCYAVDEEGWSRCFSCGHSERVPASMIEGLPVKESLALIHDVVFKELGTRGITEETCRKFNYGIGRDDYKNLVHVAPYYDLNGEKVAQKTRDKDKNFVFRGKFKDVQLFGQQVWQKGGKKLVITEGEIDAMTVAQVQGLKWATVSVPMGAGTAAKYIKQNIEFISSFEEIVVMFDSDEAGQTAAKKAMEALPVGKAFNAVLPMKDANEMLLAGRTDEIIKAIWNAKEYRPDGVVTIADIRDKLTDEPVWGANWFNPVLNAYLYGRRDGELIIIAAGTNVGKTDFMTQQMAYDRKELGEKVGGIYLETSMNKLISYIAGKMDECIYHRPDVKFDKEKYWATVDSLNDWFYLYDHVGEKSWSVLKEKIRYMVTGLGIKRIYLDNLTAIADAADMRTSLEEAVKDMVSMVHELKFTLHVVSHLTPPKDQRHEEGARVSLNQMWGNKGIARWADTVIGLERNTQAEDLFEKTTTTLRILKEREGSNTGQTVKVYYDLDKGLLMPKPVMDPAGQGEF